MEVLLFILGLVAVYFGGRRAGYNRAKQELEDWRKKRL